MFKEKKPRKEKIVILLCVLCLQLTCSHYQDIAFKWLVMVIYKVSQHTD